MKWRLAFLAAVFLATQADAKKVFANSQEAYAKICAYCHDTGVGVESVKEKYPTEAVQVRADLIFDIVRSGQAAMPPFRVTEIDDATLKALATDLAKGKFK